MHKFCCYLCSSGVFCRKINLWKHEKFLELLNLVEPKIKHIHYITIINAIFNYCLLVTSKNVTSLYTSCSVTAINRSNSIPNIVPLHLVLFPWFHSLYRYSSIPFRYSSIPYCFIPIISFPVYVVPFPIVLFPIVLFPKVLLPIVPFPMVQFPKVPLPICSSKLSLNQKLFPISHDTPLRFPGPVY